MIAPFGGRTPVGTARDGETRLTTPSRDTSVLDDAPDALAPGDALCAAMGAAARYGVQRDFSVERARDSRLTAYRTRV